VLIVIVILTWQTYKQGIFMLENDYVASVLMPVPLFPFCFVLALGFAMLCLVIVTLMIQSVAKAVKG
jgi:hypothetical protein